MNFKTLQSTIHAIASTRRGRKARPVCKLSDLRSVYQKTLKGTDLAQACAEQAQVVV